MYYFFILATLIAYFDGKTLAHRAEPHTHSEVKIVGYHGPLSKETFSLFRGAEIIEFIDCNFTYVPDRVLSLLPKLKKILVDNVTVSNVHTEATADSSDLEEYYYIRGTWDIPRLEVWNGFHNMKKFIVSEHKNKFFEITANALNETKLEVLEISKSGLEKIDDLAFNNLDKLKELKLSDNKLKTITKEMLAPLKNLRKLDLHGNLLESFSASQIPELPNLEKINLSDNPLKSLDLKGFEKVAPKLKEVKVAKSEIPELELGILRKIANMEIITEM